MMCKHERVRQPGRFTRLVYELVASLILALVTVAIIFTLLFRLVSVSGESMTNTLQNGDMLVLFSRLYTLDHGDIVVVNRPDEAPLIKRVIGLEGDVISIDVENGRMLRNGEVLDEPYVRGGFTPAFGFEGPYTVPEGHLFVMGDNRRDSMDSRQLGAMPMQQVVGEVSYRLWPFTKVE